MHLKNLIKHLPLLYKRAQNRDTKAQRDCHCPNFGLNSLKKMEILGTAEDVCLSQLID